MRIDFAPDGFEGQWVELIDIGARSQEQLEELQIFSKDEDGARAFLATVVSAWNIVNPKTGQPLPQPSSPDWATRQIPLRLVKRIGEVIKEAVDELTPKGS